MATHNKLNVDIEKPDSLAIWRLLNGFYPILDPLFEKFPGPKRSSRSVPGKLVFGSSDVNCQTNDQEPRSDWEWLYLLYGQLLMRDELIGTMLGSNGFYRVYCRQCFLIA